MELLLWFIEIVLKVLLFVLVIRVLKFFLFGEYFKIEEVGFKSLGFLFNRIRFVLLFLCILMRFFLLLFIFFVFKVLCWGDFCLWLMFILLFCCWFVFFDIIMFFGLDFFEMVVLLILYLGGVFEKLMKVFLCLVKGLEFFSCGFLMVFEIWKWEG